jgi:hypothetical protein
MFYPLGAGPQLARFAPSSKAKSMHSCAVVSQRLGPEYQRRKYIGHSHDSHQRLQELSGKSHRVVEGRPALPQNLYEYRAYLQKFFNSKHYLLAEFGAELQQLILQVNHCHS